MSSYTYQDGVLRERYDDATGTFTSWNQAGVQTATRPYTPEEVQYALGAAALLQAYQNRATLEGQAVAALDNNVAFLAIGAPTNAQVLAQTKALTRQNNAIIRLLLNKCDAIT